MKNKKTPPKWHNKAIKGVSLLTKNGQKSTVASLLDVDKHRVQIWIKPF